MIIGHQKQFLSLKKSAELNRLAHAYLFSGPEKVGKRTVALELSSFLLKEDLASKQHPDFILVGLEPEKTEIEISQIRDLIWKLALKPYSAPLKIAVIDGAHLMNKDAQNCFLKTLEEPAKDTLLILISAYPKGLLPTIISRCQVINFYPLPQKEIEKAFSKEIADISLGRPGRAVDFLDYQKLAEFKKGLKEIADVSRADFASRFQYAKEISQNNNLKEILENWLFYFRNLLIENCPKPGFERYAAILKKIQEVSSLISSTNVNSRLALEILMLEI